MCCWGSNGLGVLTRHLIRHMLDNVPAVEKPPIEISNKKFSVVVMSRENSGGKLIGKNFP
ncbi:hypothetical protein CN887_20845 [Bacillus pseudomycoides]|nr:hypothetical protein CN887_20845 [Bacillus pseudomycoides]PEM41489.1 hypothetical protein CN634_01500 [Bacillus pseudomycoides]